MSQTASDIFDILQHNKIIDLILDTGYGSEK